MAERDPVPVVDLFAGPGGLGEGFTALQRPDNRPCFKVRLSIEKDFHAHQTLLLRAFYRQFSAGRVPGLYYDVLRGTADRDTLFKRFPEQAAKATAEAWHAELGVTEHTDVRSRIKTALGDSGEWILIGGPPCQAYSVAGRSRNKGVEGYQPDKDERQYLYAEYLEIIADHWPAIFVMENVKGLLSATVLERKMFELIHEDLSNPAAAIKSRTNSRSHRYAIHSVSQRGDLFDGVDLGDFVVQAERHGIPQARHRVILVGIRDDLGSVEKSPEHNLPILDETAAKKVLDRLPAVRSGLSHGSDGSEAWLGEYGLPTDAKVFVEAYRQTNWMRFDFGTIGTVQPPGNLELPDFDTREGVLFRVRVTATANPEGRLLAEADQISPVLGKDTGEEAREPLLPIKPEDLGEEVFRVDFGDRPILLINNQFGDWRALAKSPAFVCMALPQALREILTRVLYIEGYYETEDTADWKARWLKFASLLPGSSAPPEEEEKDRFEDWINEAVAAFARMHGMKSRFNVFWSGGTES